MSETKSLFENFEGPQRQEGETFEEYRERLKEENDMLKFYRKRGRRRLKGDSIGSQRRRLMVKRHRRQNDKHSN